MKLLDLTDDEQKELQNTLVSAISEVYDKSNIENNNEDLQNAVNDILNKLDKTNLSQKLKHC